MSDRGTAERVIPPEAEGLADDLLVWLTEWTAEDVQSIADASSKFMYNYGSPESILATCCELVAARKIRCSQFL